MCYFRAIKKHSHTDTQQVFVYFTHATSTLHPLLCNPFTFFHPFCKSSFLHCSSSHSIMFRFPLLCVPRRCWYVIGDFLCRGLICPCIFILPAAAVFRSVGHFIPHPLPSLSISPKIMIKIFPSLDKNRPVRIRNSEWVSECESKNFHILSKLNTHFLPSLFYQYDALSHAHTCWGGRYLRFSHPLLPTRHSLFSLCFCVVKPD